MPLDVRFIIYTRADDDNGNDNEMLKYLFVCVTTLLIYHAPVHTSARRQA
jgi:hypothetical protein